MSLELSILDNPRPVVAFPWGSKSITKIFLLSLVNPAAIDSSYLSTMKMEILYSTNLED